VEAGTDVRYTTTTTTGATAAARGGHESAASTGLGVAVTVAVENKDEVETDAVATDEADPKGRAAEARRRRWVLPAKVISSPAEVLAGEVQAPRRAASTREAAEETVRVSMRCRRAVSVGEQAVGSIMGRRSEEVEAVFRKSLAGTRNPRTVAMVNSPSPRHRKSRCLTLVTRTTAPSHRARRPATRSRRIRRRERSGKPRKRTKAGGKQ